VSSPGVAHPDAAVRRVASGSNVLSLRAPVLANAGDGLDVPVILSGNGELQAISLSLGWNPEVVQPLSVSAGDLITSKGGVVLSPGPGRADAAILGVGSNGMDGQGEVATVHFKVLRSGEPNISIASVIGRSETNKNVSVTVQNPLGVIAPALKTALNPVIPNPSRGTSLVTYSLEKSGPASLAVYSIDGRLVKSLVHEVQNAGSHQFMWDGTNERGSAISSGMFYIRLEAAGVLKTRVVSVIR
jgi:hypothetical protein